MFKQKLNSDESVNTHKARLVAKGFSQKKGIDFEETFAPVVRFESVRTLLSLAVEFDLELHQMDVTSAFLNGTLEEDIYLVQPEGFTVPGSRKEDFVLHLKKSLYGLKQSPRCWNQELNDYLLKLGFIQSISDPCMYTKLCSEDISIVVIYVDDIIIGSNSREHIDEIKASLSKNYDMKDLG